MRVVFVGPPGSGKGTQAKLLKERLGLAYIGTGDILREAVQHGSAIGKQAAPYLNAGTLVPDAIVNDIITERMQRADRPTRFVLDGYPRTAAQAASLDPVLAKLGLGIQAVIHFLIDDDEVVRRLIGTVGRGRQDDGEETVRHRLHVFRDTSRDLLQHYGREGILHELAAVDSIEGLYTKIVRILQPHTA